MRKYVTLQVHRMQILARDQLDVWLKSQLWINFFNLDLQAWPLLNEAKMTGIT